MPTESLPLGAYRERCLSEKGEECDLCGATERIVAHHIDGNRANNRIENLLPVCRSCHINIHRNDNPTGRVGELQERIQDDIGPATIQISDETHERLKERKRVERETFNSVVALLLNETADGE